MSSKEKEIGPEEIEYKGNNAADFSKGWIYVRKARVLCFKEKPNFVRTFHCLFVFISFFLQNRKKV